ncbi:MAG TPA: BTAD domain-containing putative transcriptional regulator [Streptosporangiaceae bacterium]
MIEQSAPIRFRILGPLEVWSGAEWGQITAAKWRALLAALLLQHSQPVATDRLIADLWPGQPPANAANLVSVYVLRLRRLLGDGATALVTRPPGYQLVLAPGELDAERFGQLATEGRAALAAGDPERAAGLLSQALGLWSGPALTDVPSSPLVDAESSRLAEARVRATELRIEADLGCGRSEQVTPELQRLVADHPMREEPWALLMRALAGAGHQAEALAVYGQVRKVIADELGVEPGTALQQLYQQILNADASSPAAGRGAVVLDAAGLAAPAPAQLPADIADFTGRAGQVAQLSALLAGDRQAGEGPAGDGPGGRGPLGDGQAGEGPAAGGEPPGEGPSGSPGVVPVVLVVGSGGLGKTALAVHAAHLLSGQFAGGQLYVNLLGATEPLVPAEVLARFLRDLGADPSRIAAGEEERAAQFRTRLAGRRVLIVLDDARDAAQVRPLLPGSASCAVLITARRAMPELEGCRLLDLDVLPPAEARALFGRVAGEGRARAEPEATSGVLAACAGLPLAIRIAGARLAARGGWTVRTLAGRLADERRRLDELRAGNLAVRASFEVSFASLPRAVGASGADPARVFRLLGLWTGPSIALPAAAALAGQPETGTEEALEVLVDAHLLDTPEPDVYRFHDLLRVYAADRARAEETEPDRLAAVTRLLTWYLHTIEAAARVISPQHHRVPLDPPGLEVRPLAFPSLEEALAWCDHERAGLTAATRLAAQYQLPDIAWKLPAAAMSYFYRRSHWSDWLITHQAGLASARRLGDKPAEAWMLNNLGMAYGQQRMEESVGCFEQALALYREINDVQGESRAATNVAKANLDLHRFAEAQAAAQESLAIQRQAGKRYGEGIALGVLGCACRELGHFDEAGRWLKQALAIFSDLGDRDSEADVLADLGDLYLDQDEVSAAIEYYLESLAIRREITDRYGEASTLRRLSEARLRAGDVGEARRLLTEALLLFEELGDHAQAAEVRASLAEPM